MGNLATKKEQEPGMVYVGEDIQATLGDENDLEFKSGETI